MEIKVNLDTKSVLLFKRYLRLHQVSDITDSQTLTSDYTLMSFFPSFSLLKMLIFCWIKFLFFYMTPFFWHFNNVYLVKQKSTHKNRQGCYQTPTCTNTKLSNITITPPGIKLYRELLQFMLFKGSVFTGNRCWWLEAWVTRWWL